jgi:endonuclease YncB( thermonuclease family)
MICTPGLVVEYGAQETDIDSRNISGERDEVGSVTSATSLPSISGSLVRVIDGDTIQIDGQTLRLEGIDAPEMKQICADSKGKDYPCGRRSRAALSALIVSPIICVTSGKDKYGRYLGYCTAGRTDLNKEMVIQGWAMAFIKYNTRYVTQEAAARNGRRGIWSGSSYPPWEWRAEQIAELAPKGECVIKGNISHSRKTYYLPFHLRYSRVKIDEATGERWFCTEAEAVAAGWIRAAR